MRKAGKVITTWSWRKLASLVSQGGACEPRFVVVRAIWPESDPRAVALKKSCSGSLSTPVVSTAYFRASRRRYAQNIRLSMRCHSDSASGGYSVLVNNGTTRDKT